MRLRTREAYTLAHGTGANDLYRIKRDGSAIELLYDTAAGVASLHPKFNPAGTKLCWAQRNRTMNAIFPLGPYRREPVGRWRIHLSDYNNALVGQNCLSNHQTIQPNGDGCYELAKATATHLYYSYGDGHVGLHNVYRCLRDGTSVENLTNVTGSWNEFGIPSPADEDIFAYMSSRSHPSAVYPGDAAAILRTELYTQEGTTARRRTAMNQLLAQQAIVSDFDWNADGTAIAFQVAPVHSELPEVPEIWRLDLLT